ncbi:hypothetical protein [Peribacillus deserti]|uniref:Uncharacterized protein n=1 Tax=Peribacillus deserti TaxID=673318 RepID=A0A2N5M060_9BACI|nr:hypothetical protein [Peribacillus deserti]PLT27705.1 hypothetical protein CUU66_22565 [Peribacillus deserti]
MVTAIVIPAICIYFFWLTKRELKAQESKWKSLGYVNEDYLVKGKVVSMKSEKQKFHYGRYIYVFTFVIATDSGRITAIKKLPAREDNDFPSMPFQTEERVLVYGEWREHQFVINRIDKQNKTDCPFA